MEKFTLSILVLCAFIWLTIVYTSLNIKTKCCSSDYIILFLFFIIFIFALVMEFTDLFCEEVDINCINCGDGCSNKYISYRPSTHTTKQDAIENIDNLLTVSQKMVCWRKYFIISAFIIMFLFMYKRDLECVDLVCIFLILFVVLSFSANFYNYHFTNHLNDVIKSNLKILN